MAAAAATVPVKMDGQRKQQHGPATTTTTITTKTMIAATLAAILQPPSNSTTPTLNSDACSRNQHQQNHNSNELPCNKNNIQQREQEYHDCDYSTAAATTATIRGKEASRGAVSRALTTIEGAKQVDVVVGQQVIASKARSNGSLFMGKGQSFSETAAGCDAAAHDSIRAAISNCKKNNNVNININTSNKNGNNDSACRQHYCNINLIQLQLPNSLAFSALNYLSNIRDCDQLSTCRPQQAGFASPKLSPTRVGKTQHHINQERVVVDRQRKVSSTTEAGQMRKISLASGPDCKQSLSFNLPSNARPAAAYSDKANLIIKPQIETLSQKLISKSKELGRQEEYQSLGASQYLQKLRKNMRQVYDDNEDSRSQQFSHEQNCASKSAIDDHSKSKRFCLTMATLLVTIGLLAASQVKLAHGQQLPPRSHAQLIPTSSQVGGNIPNNNNGNGNANNNGLQQSPPQQNQHRPIASATGPPQPIAGSLVATVNCNKIRGHVTLTPNSQGSVTVSTQITEGPPGEVYQWSVHQFPVKPGAAMCTCSPLILGMKLIDFGEMHGNLPSNQEYSVQSSTLTLFGPDSPVGHSLLLRGLKTGVVACATFLPTSRKSNYRAKFHEPLSGSVTIFQTAFGSSFLSHLMYSNSTRRHSMHRFDLVKSDDDMLLLNSGHRPLTASPSQSTSNTLLIEQREHDNEISQCRRFTSGEPLLRNMTYQLLVSTENFGMRSRTALVLPQIPFETFSSVYVIVYSEHNPLEPIACAPLKFVRPKTAAAKFQTASVQGNVVFSQDSPYDPTQALINLQLPNSDGHSYGIDELPMIIRRKSDTRVCPNIREIIYNPHHIEPSSVPGEGEATSDQYAVGDLSGKYGSLAGKSAERIVVSDFNLPLFGPNSIVGRAMTVYSAEGVAIACSNVELNTPMTTAFATFDFGIQGQFIFRQAQNDCNGDTYVYIEVSRPMPPPPGSAATATAPSQQQLHSHDPSQLSRTLDHNWHVHVNPIDSGLDHLSTTECAAAGPHFNPYNTSTTSIYSRDCTPFNVLRCELGDLASKMFTLEIPPYRVKSGQEPDIGKFFGTDIDLPLCGPVSIVNRSVVVHGQDFGMSRLACSTVIEFKPRSS